PVFFPHSRAGFIIRYLRISRRARRLFTPRSRERGPAWLRREEAALGRGSDCRNAATLTRPGSNRARPLSFSALSPSRRRGFSQPWLKALRGWRASLNQ